MRVLVTGGTGGLGREVVREARSRGHTVRVASRRERPGDLPPGRDWARLDLATGAGLEAALQGVEAVAHAASDPGRSGAVDVEGTRRLVAAAARAGVDHLLYVSIVGVDHIPLAYYRSKLEAEALVTDGDVPWSVLRLTQFHAFVDALLGAAARAPLVMAVPSGFQVQSVDTGEAGARVVQALEDGPGRRLRDFGGPEVLPVERVARRWQEVRGVRKPLVPLPVPGRIARGFRAGHNTAPGGDRGTIRWGTWLEARGSAPSRATGTT